jgi:hypothetical protein
MIYFATTCDAHAHIQSVSTLISADNSARWSRFWRTDRKFTILINIEDFVGLELSLVHEVEQVFVQRQDNKKEFKVLTVVNERDPAVRTRIYAREREIIDNYPNFDFDFHIVARMNRDIQQIANGAGKLAYKR